MTTEKVKQILNENQITVKKHFGQNFLLDENVLRNIINGSKIDNDTNVIEIGPGLGFLTKFLSESSKQVLCYEIDDQMVNQIISKNYNNVNIIHDDFLNRNLDKDIEKYFNNEEVVLVANLPYYITTPILLKVLEETNKIKKMTVMMQTEVAKRICGTPSTKDYNSLSVLMQYFTNPKILFNVSPKSFYPEPGVDSSVVLIEYKDINNLEYVENINYFLKFNRNIFSQRRKTLYNNIQKNYKYNKDEVLSIIEELNLSQTVRSEALSVSQIIKLANLFYLKCENK